MYKFLFVLVFLCSNLFAIAENDGFDDGFDDDIQIKQIKKQKEKIVDIYGSSTFLQSYNYSHTSPQNDKLNDFSGLSSSKLSINLNVDLKFNKNFKIISKINGYRDFIYDLKATNYKTIPFGYLNEININELFAYAKIFDTDIKIGRQINTWGKSESIKISDILNGIDNRTPGMVDINDLKLGRLMSKISSHKGLWEFEAIALMENRFSKMPQYGSDFTPSDKKMYERFSKHPIISNDFKNMGVALSATGNLEGQDIAFYYANQFMDNADFRSNMYALSYNKVLGGLLLKTELAYFDNYDSKIAKSKIDGLFGVEYSIKNGSLSLESASKNNTIQYAFRFTQKYINDKLTFAFVALLNGVKINKGGFVRSWVDYQYNDNVKLSLGFIDYMGGDDKRFELVKNNDRVFYSLKYSL